jgi:hypothetical protein
MTCLRRSRLVAAFQGRLVGYRSISTVGAGQVLTAAPLLQTLVT